MFYRTHMKSNNCNLFEDPFCIFLMDNLHMTSHSSICLHYIGRYSNRFLHWSPTVMFYQHHITDTDCNLSMHLFCIFLLHNFDIHCLLSIYLSYTKWVPQLDINYFPPCMNNHYIQGLFFHLSMTHTYKHSGPMGMYMRYYNDC